MTWKWIKIAEKCKKSQVSKKDWDRAQYNYLSSEGKEQKDEGLIEDYMMVFEDVRYGGEGAWVRYSR